MYKPHPVDTSDVRLPEELTLLTETIAKNVHDVWASGRIEEGWVYGPVQDLERRITPLLVPYEELPESEKDYDRRTAFETLRLIIRLGFDIRRVRGEDG